MPRKAREVLNGLKRKGFIEEREGHHIFLIYEATTGRRTDIRSEIELRIADDGAGLPPGFDMRAAKGLGMRIVRALAEQLAARVEVKARNPGTEFILVVPLTPKD